MGRLVTLYYSHPPIVALLPLKDSQCQTLKYMPPYCCYNVPLHPVIIFPLLLLTLAPHKKMPFYFWALWNIRDKFPHYRTSYLSRMSLDINSCQNLLTRIF